MKSFRAFLSAASALVLLLVRPAHGQLEVLAAFDNNGAGGPPSASWRGGSQISGYEGWAILNTATLGAFAGATFNVGQGYALETPQLAELILSKVIDEITPKLLSTLGSGREVAKIEIQLVNFAGQGQPRRVVRYVLGRATLRSQDPVLAAGTDPLTEWVSIHYRTLEITYFAYDPVTGDPDPAKNVTRFYNQTNP